MTADGDLPELPNPYRAIQKMRACEGDAAAQLLLEHYTISYARLAVQQERERCAKIAEAEATCNCNGEQGRCNINDMPLYIAKLIRSIKDDSQEEERKT